MTDPNTNKPAQDPSKDKSKPPADMPNKQSPNDKTSKTAERTDCDTSKTNK